MNVMYTSIHASQMQQEKKLRGGLDKQSAMDDNNDSEVRKKERKKERERVRVYVYVK